MDVFSTQDAIVKKNDRSGNYIIISNKMVYKIIFFSKFGSNETAYIDDLTHPSHVELYFTDLISQYVECNHHIVKCNSIALYENDQINEATKKIECDDKTKEDILNEANNYHKNFKKIGIIEYEYAQTNLDEYIKENINNDDFEIKMKEITFQIFYQLHVIKSNIKNFMHGDLKPDNILMVNDVNYKPNETQYYCYTFNEQNYYIPVRKYIPKIWDFEYSTSLHKKNQIAHNIKSYDMADIFRFFFILFYEIKTVTEKQFEQVRINVAPPDAYADWIPVIDPETNSPKMREVGSKEVIKIERNLLVSDKLKDISNIINITASGSTQFMTDGNSITITYLDFLKDNMFNSFIKNNTKSINICYNINCPLGNKLYALKKKCIVFDFDCTLTSKHLYKSLRENTNMHDLILKLKPNQNNEKYKNDIIEYVNDIFGGIERIAKLKSLFSNLKDANIDLYISSRGVVAEIASALLAVDLYSYFQKIYGITETNGGQNKTKLIYGLYDKYNEIIYIDDNHSEHNDFKNSLGKPENKSSNEKTIVYEFDNMKYIFIQSLTYENGGINDTHMELIKTLTIPSQKGGYTQHNKYYKKYIKYKYKYLSLKN
ncbi:protein kinase [Indivirus ILV1]|uniref:Protein kinase n=1 Tax=Indivirus ILV1 TaxID=1977633 RepID=A0A1V0SEE6_9VIRU|nr:protein kinase [Indivirus ILV1]